MLSAGIDNLPVTGPDRFSTSAEDMTMKRIGIAQEWVSADKRAAREAAAQAMAGRESVMEQVAAAEARCKPPWPTSTPTTPARRSKLATLNETTPTRSWRPARAAWPPSPAAAPRCWP